jgi:hypothetical protein
MCNRALVAGGGAARADVPAFAFFGLKLIGINLCSNVFIAAQHKIRVVVELTDRIV